MSPLQANISATILPELDGVTAHEKWLSCATEYPWYPLPWLMLASHDNKNALQKAALWFNDEQRLHYVLHEEPLDKDEWLRKSLQAFEDEPIFTNAQTTQAQTLLLDHTPDEEEIIEDTADRQADESTLPEAETIIPDEPTAVITNDETAAIIANDDEAEPSFPQEIIEIPEPEEPALVYGPSPEPVIETIPAPGPVEKDTVSIPSINAAIPAAESFVFEPYHSVDYFASQGIKLELPKEPVEKFDKQLKSFTQWLKTMKKVTAADTVARPSDPLVEAQASASVSGKEIITEAMAQVLEKQGKYPRAIEIYEKLLLLHPEKSVFFAAQIEELKNKQ